MIFKAWYKDALRSHHGAKMPPGYPPGFYSPGSGFPRPGPDESLYGFFKAFYYVLSYYHFILNITN
jgi:hypothetical protein